MTAKACYINVKISQKLFITAKYGESTCDVNAFQNQAKR